MQQIIIRKPNEEIIASSFDCCGNPRKHRRLSLDERCHLFCGKDVDGIYVEEELRIATDNHHGISYCKLLKKAINGNQEDIKK